MGFELVKGLVDQVVGGYFTQLLDQQLAVEGVRMIEVETAAFVKSKIG